MYIVLDAPSSVIYDFRKDFSTIATPGMRSYLREFGFYPDDPEGSPDDDHWCTGQVYALGLWRLLKYKQQTALDEVWDAKEATKVASSYESEMTIARWESGREAGQLDIGLYRAMGLVRPAPDLELRVALDHTLRKAADDFEIRRAAWYAERQAQGQPQEEEEPATSENSKQAGCSRSDPLDAIELGKGCDWTRPDGAIGALADWFMTQMSKPNRPLAVAAALATITPVVGWRNLHSPTNCALNGYYVGLGATAVGKDAMLKLPGRVLATVPVPKLYSSSDAFSLSAQEKILHDHPAIVLALDEIATNMFPRMFSSKSNSHESSMKGMHMKLFSRNMGDPSTASRRGRQAHRFIWTTCSTLSSQCWRRTRPCRSGKLCPRTR